MKPIYFLLTVVLLVSITASSQKYSNSDVVEVKQDYNGLNLNSKNNLKENLSLMGNFETTIGILDKVGAGIIGEEDMVTVFAVSDNGFEAMIEDKLEAFLADEYMQGEYLKFLTVPGRMDSHSLKRAIEKNNGNAQLRTLKGEKLTISLKGDQLIISDNNGNSANWVSGDLYHYNGFLHIIEKPLFPKSEEE